MPWYEQPKLVPSPRTLLDKAWNFLVPQHNRFLQITFPKTKTYTADFHDTLIMQMTGHEGLRMTFENNTLNLSKNYPKRIFTLQAGESDHDLLTRLWRQEGICWHFTHDLVGNPYIPQHTLSVGRKISFAEVQERRKTLGLPLLTRQPRDEQGTEYAGHANETATYQTWIFYWLPNSEDPQDRKGTARYLKAFVWGIVRDYVFDSKGRPC